MHFEILSIWIFSLWCGACIGTGQHKRLIAWHYIVRFSLFPNTNRHRHRHSESFGISIPMKIKTCFINNRKNSTKRQALSLNLYRCICLFASAEWIRFLVLMCRFFFCLNMHAFVHVSNQTNVYMYNECNYGNGLSISSQCVSFISN